MARFRSPLINKAWDTANAIAILRNANSYYLQARQTNPTTTLTVDELIKGGIALAHDKAMAKQVKAQNEANRGRPEIEYPQHTNSGDAGKVAQLTNIGRASALPFLLGDIYVVFT